MFWSKSFYIAIPAMIFHSICHVSTIKRISFKITIISIISITIVFILCRFFCYITSTPTKLSKSISQCSIHGNLGYIGLAVVFFYAGAEGLAKSSFLAAFIIIFQNFLSITGFQIDNIFKKTFSLLLIGKIFSNPVICASILGIIFSSYKLVLPTSIDKTLDILSKFALPLSLLITGASISIPKIKKCIFSTFATCISKLILLPLLATIIFRHYNFSIQEYMPALILLSSPTATISCIMAREMGGDIEFSSAAVSISTIVSIFTLSFWLKINSVQLSIT